MLRSVRRTCPGANGVSAVPRSRQRRGSAMRIVGVVWPLSNLILIGVEAASRRYAFAMQRERRDCIHKYCIWKHERCSFSENN